MKKKNCLKQTHTLLAKDINKLYYKIAILPQIQQTTNKRTENPLS